MASRIVRFVISVLVLIVLAEIGYYAYIVYYNENKMSVPPAAEVSRENRDSSTVSYPIIDAATFEKLGTLHHGALNSQNVSLLFNMQQGTVNSSELTTVYEGTIDRIDTNPGRYYNFDYHMFFTVTNGANPPNVIYLNSHDMSVTRVVDRSAGAEIPLAASDLKAGDRVQVTRIMDMTKDITQTTISMTIAKL